MKSRGPGSWKEGKARTSDEVYGKMKKGDDGIPVKTATSKQASKNARVPLSPVAPNVQRKAPTTTTTLPKRTVAVSKPAHKETRKPAGVSKPATNLKHHASLMRHGIAEDEWASILDGIRKPQTRV